MSADNQNRNIIEWSYKETEFKTKSASWYWILIIICVLLIALAVWQKNFLFAVLILVSGISLIFIAGDRPDDRSFKINNKGIWIDEDLYPWSDWHSFAIREREGPISMLDLHSDKKFHPVFKIPFFSADIDKIRDLVNNYLPEVEGEDSLIDEITNLLGL